MAGPKTRRTQRQQQQQLLTLILLCLYTWGAAVTDQEDIAALEALKQSLDPSGQVISWGSGDPCDDLWDGIFCQSNRVTEIHLMNRGLSGTIAPHVGSMANLQILNLMWNKISGNIPSTIGKLQVLRLLLLNGNQLVGPIPPEVGNLVNLDRLQLDENQLSGPIPSTFEQLVKVRHLHMNNNTLNGSIPPELGRLPALLHLLVDNNNLSGLLPSQLSDIPRFQILQMDNNKFDDNATIPPSYGTMEHLLKLSTRGCNLQGPLPDLSGLLNLEYLDLSNNRITGEITRDTLGTNISAVDLSNNLLVGEIPATFARLEKLQVLQLQNNQLNSTVSSDFLNITHNVILNFQNNSLAGFPSNAVVNSSSVKIWLSGNSRVCTGNRTDAAELCTPEVFAVQADNVVDNITTTCRPEVCVPGQNELVPELALNLECLCASPIQVTCRLKSPGFILFSPFKLVFQEFMAAGLELENYQVYVASHSWEPGPRVLIQLKIFPAVKTPGRRSFNTSEARSIFNAFATWHIRDNPLFGPREFLNFMAPFGIELFPSLAEKSDKSLSKGALAGILISVIAVTAGIVAVVVLKLGRGHRSPSARRRLLSINYKHVKFDNVRTFTLAEIQKATASFSREIGQGGYGKVYKGVLENQQLVAIKRADENSYQGAHEFFTEIELLSRVHHRNLVSLVGFCLDEGEQLLVYEYVGGGSLHDRLSGNAKHSFNFRTRVHIALGAARGILYLHTEATPPIIHRDIKGTNILLTEKNVPKVSDFGLSRLAPEEIVEDASRHVSTVVKGTPGYLDPEYFLTRKLSDKSDIYSYGVVLMELITGKQAIYQGKNLVREVRQTYEAGIVVTLVDPRMGAYPSDALEPLVRLALNCCADTAEERPSIRTVVRELEDICKNTHKGDPYHENEGSYSTLSFDVAASFASSSSRADDFPGGLELVPR